VLDRVDADVVGREGTDGRVLEQDAGPDAVLDVLLQPLRHWPDVLVVPHHLVDAPGGGHLPVHLGGLVLLVLVEMSLADNAGVDAPVSSVDDEGQLARVRAEGDGDWVERYEDGTLLTTEGLARPLEVGTGHLFARR